MLTLHKNLSLVSLTPEMHAQTCNYWYVVRVDISTPHTAFTTRSGLEKWMQERGISFTEPLPQQGEHSFQKLNGAYYENMTMDEEAFERIEGQEIDKLSNGEYTLGILTKSEDNLVVVNFLNPNCDRQVHDYQIARERCA